MVSYAVYMDSNEIAATRGPEVDEEGEDGEGLGLGRGLGRS